MTMRTNDPNQSRWDFEPRGYQIRSIRPSDVQLVSLFVDGLSPGTLYFRYGRRTPPVVSEADIARICNPDPDRVIGYVAHQRIGNLETLLGLGRIECDATKRQCEFVIVVGDAWQGAGIGRALMSQLIYAARTWGVDRMYGDTLPSNHSMHRFCEKLGFVREHSNAMPGLVRMQIDFSQE